MKYFILLLTAVSVLTPFSQTDGSVVQLLATPGSVKPYMTSHLTIQCLLNDSVAGGGLVGRAVTSAPVSSTSETVAVVTSLIITKKDYGTIATITVATPAVVVGNLNNVSVAGDVSGGNGVKGHLDLNWWDPTEDIEGLYTCEVNALTSQGHSIVLQKSVNITAEEPSVADVVKHMYSHNRDMVAEISQHKAQITVQQAQIANSQKEIADLRAQLAKVNSSSHVEVNQLSCYDATFYSGGTTTRYVTRDVTFTNSYVTPPAVMVSPVEVDSSNTYDASYLFYVSKVTTTGFSVNCYALDQSQISSLKLRWMSVAV